MTTVQTISSVLINLGFCKIEQFVGSSLWSKSGVSIVAHDNGLIRAETLRDVRTVRCVNQPPLVVRNSVQAIVRDLLKGEQ